MTEPDEQLVTAFLRDRLLLPEGTIDGEASPYYPDDVPDLWVAPLFEGDEGRVAVIQVIGGMPAAQAGLDRASARLRDLDVLGTRRAFARERLPQLLDAVGGRSPGWWPFTEVEPSEDVDGGLRQAFSAPETWITYAASGARGIPPERDAVEDARGITPPTPHGTMTVTLGAGTLTWEYLVGGDTIGSFVGRADRAAEEPADQLLAERLVAAVRRELPSPLAVAARPPVLVERQSYTTTWSVELLGHDAVLVDEAGGVPRLRR